MSALDLEYDDGADLLRASLRPASRGDLVRVRQDKLSLCIDRKKKLVISFDISDFRHFVNYHLLDELFGDDVVRKIAAFQSEVVATSRRSQQVQVPALPRSNRRVVETLLRAA